MARLPRFIAPDQVHYVVQHGHDGLAAFRSAEDYLFFLHCLRDAARRFQVAIHAYALLPDQVELLATPADAIGLARMMQWVGRHYVPYFNRRHQRSGTLWQGRYKTTVIEAARYLLQCSILIESHPVRAGLAALPVDFAWTSYMHHVGAHPDGLITEHAVFWALGNTPFEREAAYRALAGQEPSANDAAALTSALRKGWVLGSPLFIAMLEKRGGSRVQPAKRGRPAMAGKTLEADNADGESSSNPL